MKRIFAIVLLVLMFVAAVPLFSGCGEEVTTLYVYNWGEYISDGTEDTYDTNAAFEEWYFNTYGKKVKVNYTTYASNEDMFNKIKNGGASYDVIIPSDYMIARMIENGFLRKLNFDNIPNAANIDMSAVLGDEAPFYDPTSEYSVPYTYGTVGVIYNTERVAAEDIGSWDLMWNEKYKGDILQFNNSRDGFATAQFLLGYSVNSTDEAEWRAALQKLIDQKEIVQGYVMDEVFNKMENGSAAVAPYYAGDFFTMYEDNKSLAFYYPEEGTNVFVDAMCVPTCSQNPELGEIYINFMLSEEAAIANAEYICYASPNKLVYENADYIAAMQEIHPDAMEILYGTADVKMEFYENLPDEQLMLVEQLWEELKIESPINFTIIIVAVVIVAALVAVAAFLVVRRKRRRKYL